ncbi:SusD family protein [Pedobacter steynii]|uniref:SusD family protein n=1 Tax=Pedobacter steynii TaxID=430522 RepID=A0A1H0D180_9SPHI|nr:RagB/SusD family nutrient uptake outer membrane protein [Pedobacter steynii]NQX41717.1 RagB/SusD family nutrient uptake outer membrane protein [Pedobacter steynii]SDN63796.1 SusD family protein [Pedobacter steynii]
MNLNKLTYIIAAVFLIPFLGCKKDLNTSPTNSVESSAIYSNTANIETVLNGTWAYMHETFFTFANPGYSTILRMSDAMGDDVAIIQNKYGYADSYNFSHASNTSRLSAIWTILYKVIDNCNNIITKIDAASGPEADKARIKAQALALRANSYLNLVTYYQFNYQVNPLAKGVPLYTEPTTPATEPKAKSSLEDIYKLIVSDLTQAAQSLPTYKRPNTTKYKINIDVVHGLLARTYLNMGKWDLAAQEALEAKKNYTYMSAGEYANGFNDLKNSEWIWGQAQQADQSNASYSFHYIDVATSAAYYYSFMADPNFLKLFDATDIRTKLFLWDGLPGREGYLRYQKFKFRPDVTGDIVMMRSAEMTLIAAEGYARNGDLSNATTVLNELLSARQASPFILGSKSKEEVIAAILIERRKELWGEGFSLSDILRTQSAVVRLPALGADGQPLKVTVITPDGKTKEVLAKQHTTLKFPDKEKPNFVPNSPYYLIPLPQAELDNNPNINK